MKQACVSFGGGTLKAAVAKGLPMGPGGTYSIPQAIQFLAATFCELQEKRHLADYDLTERFTRVDVLGLIEQARNRVADFAQLPTSDDKRFFFGPGRSWQTGDAIPWIELVGAYRDIVR